MRATRSLRALQNAQFTSVELTHHSVLSVRGPDALPFLQRYATCDTRALGGGAAAPPGGGARAQFGAFLTAKGRTLACGTLSAPRVAGGETCVFVEVRRELAGALLAHLAGFRLRARVELGDASRTHAAHALLPAAPFSGGTLFASAAVALEAAWGALEARGGGGGGYWDARGAPSTLGARMVVARDGSCGGAAMLATCPSAPLGRYELLRRLAGAAEGPEVSGMVPLEWNATLLRAVSYDKGCYLGQELVARAHFRGQVRKRVVPFVRGPPPRGAPPEAVGGPCGGPGEAVAALLRGGGGGGCGGGGCGGGGGVAPFTAGARLHSSETGAPVGRVILPPDGDAPVGLAVVRLAALAHTLPAPPPVRGTAPDGSAPLKGNPSRETVEGWPGGGALGAAALEAEGGAGAPGAAALAARCGGAPPADVWCAGEGAAGEGADARAPIQPLLPLWWQHVAHSGQDAEAGGEE
jgi:folate-binding protein YgfZ